MRDSSHLIHPLDAVPRRMGGGGPVPLHAVGFITAKRDWINRTFRQTFFSCITRGRGTYLLDGRSYRIEAPCVFVEYPGVLHRYGPDEGTHWDETFLCFGSGAPVLAKLKRSGLLDRAPCWPAGLPGPFLANLALLPELIARGAADLADRAAELALAASLQPLLADDPVDRAVATVQAAFEADVRRDITALIQECGIPRTTFRRRWHGIHRMAPVRWAMSRRLEQAAQHLASGDLPVHDVAIRVGIGDPFYFTRCFRTRFGRSPREHRSWGRDMPG